jgi:hypothetical protein
MAPFDEKAPETINSTAPVLSQACEPASGVRRKRGVGAQRQYVKVPGKFALECIMALFDNIESNLETIAGKVGLPADQVREIANSVQANLTSSDGNPAAALEAAAAQHGVSVDTIHEILNHGGGLESELGDYVGNLFKPGI